MAPALPLSIGSVAPLVVSATVTPGGPPVTIDVYRAGGRRSEPPIYAKQLSAGGGSFHAWIRQPAPAGM